MQPQNEVWIARIDSRIVAVTETKQDMVDFLRQQCQFFDIRTDNAAQVTGQIRYRQSTEVFDVSIQRYPIRYPIKSSVHTEQKG